VRNTRNSTFPSVAVVTLGLGLGVAPAMAAGPESGVNVNVVNTPANPVPVTGSLGVTANTPLPVSIVDTPATPVQLLLRGSFEAGDINLTTNILGPRSYTAPDGSSLLLKYISCVAFLAADQKIHIELVADFDFGSSSGPGRLVDLILDAPVFSFNVGTVGPRRTANQPMHAYLGVTTPDGPTIGRTLALRAQRSADTSTGGVECTVGGELLQ
jgi:hypothetical protein